MGRPKKENKPISMRLATNVFERLTDFCESSGQTKTIAIERAIMMYIDDYEKKLKQLEAINTDK